MEPGSLPRQMQALLIKEGHTTALFNAAKLVLGRILGVEEDAFQIEVEGRHSRRFVAGAIRGGKIAFRIPNLLGLSAGQSALFCLFCNILRDFDLAGVQFSKSEEIRGIVLIDEADLHLHLDLQFHVLPELMKLFPKVQFIVTAHSPLFVMGMRKTFGEDGFQLVDMPSGNRISTEAYSEFVAAFDAFGTTKAFEAKMLAEVRASSKPLVLVEGAHDKAHLETAWEKLHSSSPMPFEVLSCGTDGTKSGSDKGGAKRLNSMLEVLGRFERRVCVGIFDNDCAGAVQFNGLGLKQGFTPGADDLYRTHGADAVHALLLPTPLGREAFVPTGFAHRVLELEHYYSDGFLAKNGAAESPIYAGSPVFPIRDSAKSALVEAAKSAPASEFTNFAPLFTRLVALLKIPVESEQVAST